MSGCGASFRAGSECSSFDEMMPWFGRAGDGGFAPSAEESDGKGAMTAKTGDAKRGGIQSAEVLLKKKKRRKKHISRAVCTCLMFGVRRDRRCRAKFRHGASGASLGGAAALAR